MKQAFLLLGALALAAATGARAEPAPEVRLSAFQVVTQSTPAGARESLVPLQSVRPGDTVEYVADYVNPTPRTLHGVQVTVPVPAGGLQYIGAHNAPRATSASLDGLVYASLPLMREETTAGGQRVLRPVPLADYRWLRWDLGDVPAGASRSVRARMQLPRLEPVASAANPVR